MINQQMPVSQFMTTDLVTVDQSDSLQVVAEIFDSHRIHHIPVVRYKSIIGMISKSDFLLFRRGGVLSTYDQMIEQTRMERYKVSDIMTPKLASLEPTDKIGVAIEVFRENLFHAIPVVGNDELLGILTTWDLIKAIE